MNQTMNKSQRAKLTKSQCPVCNHRGFILNLEPPPRAYNVECANAACRARFDITLDETGSFVKMAYRATAEGLVPQLIRVARSKNPDGHPPR